jgi:transcription-repair coupling factor (superfamily II helicase)
VDAFACGEVDVLVATTLIENGIDIPTAGTILVDDADRFGLSELHQLRGRVGRGAHKAFCHLLIEKHKPIRDVARMRLKALEEMNRLGAGFDISVKDLELRGAGNILGAEQSGHIGAVGYDMYCKLLKAVVDRVQAGASAGDELERTEEREGGVELEPGYARSCLRSGSLRKTRIELLRELAQIKTNADVERIEAMLRDRFGRIPAEALMLVRVLRGQGRASMHWTSGA